jgi:cobalt-zinc-cadmium efflux system outer membrane protein
MAQKDFTTPPFGGVHSVVVGMPLPLFDRNQGNIRQAQGKLLRAEEEAHRVRSELTTQTAEAFERYQNQRALLEMYRMQILPNQVQAFRAAVARHFRAGEKGGVSYNDLVTSEQTLAALINQYLNTLRDQWSAVVDLANLLQTADLFQSLETDPVAPVPDLEKLSPLACQHPCSPINEPGHLGADGFWPNPGQAETIPLPKSRKIIETSSGGILSFQIETPELHSPAGPRTPALHSLPETKLNR